MSCVKIIIGSDHDKRLWLCGQIFVTFEKTKEEFYNSDMHM
jgi:hypothetical protein